MVIHGKSKSSKSPVNKPSPKAAQTKRLEAHGGEGVEVSDKLAVGTVMSAVKKVSVSSLSPGSRLVYPGNKYVVVKSVSKYSLDDMTTVINGIEALDVYLYVVFFEGASDTGVAFPNGDVQVYALVTDSVSP